MSTSRKTPRGYKSMGGQRKSSRISALEASKEDHDRGDNQQKQLIKTNKKKKFDNSSSLTPVSKLAKQVWKGRDIKRKAADDHSTDCVAYLSNRESQSREEDGKAASRLPPKHTLELVLDTLQRRDTYEIFAQPVDPDEVEEYYNVIQEPMDFGTMRAKLHEGMYKNLRQFERDVFLILENAMHFNSPTTIYFKQAHSLHELAHKVFRTLRTDPENFASEFSGKRRRSMRKALSHPKESSRFNDSSEGALSPHAPSTSTCQPASKKDSADSSGNFHARKFVTGNSRDGRLCDVEGSRDSYRKSRSSLCEENTNLLLVNPLGEFSYNDSLMTFVKDLGPAAQMVARLKLLGQHESNKGCVVQSVKPPEAGANPLPVFKTFRDFAPAGGCNPFLSKPRKLIDLEEDHATDRETRTPTTPAPATKGGKEKSDTCPTASASGVTSTSKRSNRVAKKDGSAASFRSSEDNMRPVILALEISHPNINGVGEYKSRNTKSSLMTANMPPPPSPPPPSVTKFVFDLPFLKARLQQMNEQSAPASASSRLFEKGVERGPNRTRQLF